MGLQKEACAWNKERQNLSSSVDSKLTLINVLREHNSSFLLSGHNVLRPFKGTFVRANPV